MPGPCENFSEGQLHLGQCEELGETLWCLMLFLWILTFLIGPSWMQRLESYNPVFSDPLQLDSVPPIGYPCQRLKLGTELIRERSRASVSFSVWFQSWEIRCFLCESGGVAPLADCSHSVLWDYSRTLSLWYVSTAFQQQSSGPFNMGCICFLGLPEQITINWIAENNKRLFSHGSGCQKFKIKVSSSPSSFYILTRILPCLLLALVVASNLWYSLACSCILSIFASIITWPFPHVSLCLHMIFL